MTKQPKAGAPMRLVLQLDHGLAANLNAIAKCGLHGGLRRTAVALLRNAIIEARSSAGLRDAIEANLPARYRSKVAAP